MRTLIIAAAAVALAPAAIAADISVDYSAEFAEKLQDDYGTKEGERLSEDIREDLDRELRKANIDPASISVTILDAKPNRPTMKQLGDTPGLDAIRSKSIGGMDLRAVAYAADGSMIAEFEYDWYENNIEMVQVAGTWSDANRASDRFARKFVEKLSGE